MRRRIFSIDIAWAPAGKYHPEVLRAWAWVETERPDFPLGKAWNIYRIPYNPGPLSRGVSIFDIIRDCIAKAELQASSTGPSWGKQ